MKKKQRKTQTYLKAYFIMTLINKMKLNFDLYFFIFGRKISSLLKISGNYNNF